MKKYIILFFVAFIATLSACKEAPAVRLTITGILLGGKTWRIQSATHGTEVPPPNYYDNLRITFTDKQFGVINPDNAVFLGLNSPPAGTWVETSNEQGITFSNDLRIWKVKEVSRFLSPNSLTLEYTATETGKPATKYTYVLVPQ